VTEINRTKPILIMKGGVTESGARAVASHTGSLSGGPTHLGRFLPPDGGRAVSLPARHDGRAAVFPAPRASAGPRVAIIGGGGGIGVSAADTCHNAGLDVTVLAAETREALRKFVPAAGTVPETPWMPPLPFSN